MRTWIEKQKYLIDFTLSSMLRRKVKNVSLLFIYTLIVFLLASVTLFTNALRREASATLAGSPDLLVQRMVAGRHDVIPPDYIEKLGNLRGVQKKEGRLWGYYYDPTVAANYTFMVPPADSGTSLAPGRIQVGATLARELGVKAGSAVSFEGYDGESHSFTVAGVFSNESELLTADLVLIGAQDFRTFFHYPEGCFTDIALSVANPRELRNIAAKVAARLPDSRTILREETLRTYDSIFSWREGIVLVLLTGAVAAFVIFALEKASGLSSDEKREIGILKAIGWETGDVIAMKFWEGALVSLTAFLLGYVAAYAHVYYFSSALFEPVLKGWSVLYPSFTLRPVVDGFEMATLFFLTVFPYALATIAPIWRAAITDPDMVMRGAE